MTSLNERLRIYCGLRNDPSPRTHRNKFKYTTKLLLFVPKQICALDAKLFLAGVRLIHKNTHTHTHIRPHKENTKCQTISFSIPSQFFKVSHRCPGCISFICCRRCCRTVIAFPMTYASFDKRHPRNGHTVAHV